MDGVVVIRPPIPRTGGEPTMVGVPVAARMLGLSKEMVRQLIERGDLAALDVGTAGKHFYRVPVDVIDRYAASHTVQPTRDAAAG
jgi:excisionase family DNA binding protein